MQPKHNKRLVPLAKLLIELDGSQHYADRSVKEVGRNFRGVCAYIDAAVKQSLSQLR